MNEMIVPTTCNNMKLIQPTHVKFKETLIRISDIVKLKQTTQPDGTHAIRISMDNQLQDLFIKYTTKEERDHDFKTASDCMTKTCLIFD